MLEITLLSRNDFDWSPPAAVKDRLQDGAVLCAAAPADYDDNSSQEQSAAAAPAPAATAAAAAGAAPAAPANEAAAAPADNAPAAAPAAPAAAAAGTILNVNNFINWTPDTLALLDWDAIAFPSNPAIIISTVRS